MKTDVTVLLEGAQAGVEGAAERLMQHVYGELRAMAAVRMSNEPAGQTLQPTALVHEAWMRLVDEGGRSHFENRAHFFGAASEAMRRVLVDRARRRLAEKRGAGAVHAPLDEFEIQAPAPSTELLQVNDALDQLAMVDPRKAELVKLRYFVGLSFEEVAALLNISVPTAHRDWAYARAWLRVEIEKKA